MATELQKGFGAALLRRSSPEGKLIADLQQRAAFNVQAADVTLTAAALQAMPTQPPLELVPAPGPAEWYQVMGWEVVFRPGADAGDDPLVSANSASLHLAYGSVDNVALDAATPSQLHYTGADAYFLVRFTGGADVTAALAFLLGQPITLAITDETEVITGNAAGDATLHVRVYYRVRNLDF